MKLTVVGVFACLCISGAAGHLKPPSKSSINVSKSPTRASSEEQPEKKQEMRRVSSDSYDVSILKTPVSVLSGQQAVAAATAGPVQLQGLLTVLGGVLAHLTFGTLYCWGNFLSYSPPELRFFDGKDHTGKQPDALAVIPITMISQCLTMPLGPLITQRLGASKTMLLGAWIMALGVFLSSYTKSLGPFIFLYSFLFGAGVGIGYTAPMSAGWKWMPDKKGLISGVVLTGFGAGGFFFNLIGTKIVNPGNAELVNGRFPAEVYANFPKMLRTLAVIYAAMSFLGSLLVKEPVVVKQAPVPPAKGQKAAAPVVNPYDLGVTLPEALGTKQFWLLWLMIMTSATAGLNVASVYKQFAGSAGTVLKGDSYQALVGGLGALFNGLGRLFWGSLSDKIGFKSSFTILTIIQAGLHVLFPFSKVSKEAFAAATCLCYFCLAGNFALMPPAVQRLFGAKNGALIYGIVYSAFGTASIGGLLLSKALLVKVGWSGLFQIFAGMSLLATVLTQLLLPLKSLPSSTI